MPARQVLAERFWKYVREGPDCWEWQGARLPKGYGSVFLSRPYASRTTAHRAAWALTHGPIPEGMLVLHRCDTPPCVRPEHLFLGTYADNMADMVTKGRGRAPSGEANGLHRLTPAAVQHIRANPDGLSGRALARQFGVAATTVRRIRLRLMWRHLAEED